MSNGNPTSGRNRQVAAPSPHGGNGHFKDAILDELARRSSVAQFVSFAPDLSQRYSWIRGCTPNQRFDSAESAVAMLLERSPESSVNIRSFEPQHPKSREFVYGLGDVQNVMARLRTLAGAGLFTIVNETINVEDGGVSGVAFGRVIEFAPGDTPRCVEKPGTAALPRELGLRLLQVVYGFAPALPDDEKLRVEFSIHPLRRGYQHEHTIVWEVEQLNHPPLEPRISWPNRFSRFLGDKAYGLLVAYVLELPVPHTVVMARRVAPFSFGRDTGIAEPWIRTCPTEQVPGRFTTQRGWRDPYRLIAEEDPSGESIASLLRQQGVEAQHSGAVVTQSNGDLLIEGVSGRGDEFMQGTRPPERLPQAVRSRVSRLYEKAAAHLGPVRFEWVDDGSNSWVVQLHCGASSAMGSTVYPGQVVRYHYMPVSHGIDALRELIDRVAGTGEGIVLVGRVGVTSHLGDLLRRAKIPSRIESEHPEGASAR